MKRATRGPSVNKSTHPRKFGNHVTERPATDRPSVRTTGIPMFTLTLSYSFLTLSLSFLLWEPRRKLIAHQCCGQLTAVKTGYPLTSITWPYRGLRCRPIKVEYFFEVIRWQFTRFQMIAGSRLLFFKIHIKYVVFMSVSPRTITILISNWPQTQKFSQFF